MTEHTPAALLREIAEVMEECPGDWWRHFHRARYSWVEVYRDPLKMMSDVLDGHDVRRTPSVIWIGDVEVPEPMRRPPELGKTYYIADPGGITLCDELTWDGDSLDRMWLKRQRCHMTPEAAQAHARAEIIASGGEVE